MTDFLEIQGKYYILASSSVADVAARVLKQGETFAIFDRHGDIRPLGFETQGLFHEGTRYVSRLKLDINGQSPLLLSSNVREDNDLLIADLTNPDLPIGEENRVRSGIIHFVRTSFLWEARCFERIEVSNFGTTRVEFTLTYSFQADFCDLFELRGNVREQRGRVLGPMTTPDSVVLSYEGLDGVVRRTEFKFGQEAREISGERAVFSIALEPHERLPLDLRISCFNGPEARDSKPFDVALEELHEVYTAARTNATAVETSNEKFNNWLDQSRADLHMLLSHTDCGLYPYAGIPWFSCPFGRDGIITALETLWIYPDIARGVLRYLAKFQATEANAAKDSEPGKILHEQRQGEMAALGEIPFGQYYGTIDATPLFIVLAGRYFDRTDDREFLKELWPNIERALEWIDKYGDCDGDGFVEYRRQTDRGLSNQGWKDSEDSIFHADGTLADAPIALCEVQGYVYEAKVVAAKLAAILGHVERSKDLEESATRLKDAFNDAFWCEEIQTFAIALDGQKKPCRVLNSNAGHCLFSGIATEAHAAAIASEMLGPKFSSGWGIRTIAKGEPRYNPMSYHNGSIWPHDNAIVAHGLARYGFTSSALRVMEALFEASQFMDLNRLPELYCGFTRRPGEGPTLYPVACNPQAWAAASVFSFLQSCLGLRISAAERRIYFEYPALPDSLRSVELRDLRLPCGTADITLQKQGAGVGVSVNRRSGEVDVVVVH
jgi:glycogen debranching enzyme